MPGIEWKRICCPVDFSDTSREALAVAVGLAQRFDAALTILHAHETPALALPTGDLLFTPKMMAEVETRVDKLLGEYKAKAEALGATNVSMARRIGTAFMEIVRFAREERCDLVVMGTHGRTALQHVLLGSVAEKVVRLAPCPVLTVRHGRHDEPL